MTRRIQLKKRLKRQRISFRVNRRLVFVLAVVIALLSIFASTVPTYTQTPTSAKCGATPNRTECEKRVAEIKEYAKRHVSNDTPMQTKVVIDLFRGDQAGLTLREIGKIYEEEYTSLKEEKDSNLWEKVNIELLHGLGWIAAVVFLVLFVFKEGVQGWGTTLLNSVGNCLYNKVADIRFVWAISLRRYRKALINKHQQLRIPFRPNRALNTRKVYVPLKVTSTSDSDLIDADRAVAEHPRLMVKGSPGSGKSMLLKYIMLRYAEGSLSLLRQPVPVLLELHRLSEPGKSLIEHLLDALARDDFPHAQRFVSHSLEQGTLMLLLDGLDEVNSSVRGQVIQQIKDLLDQYSNCRAIITCRTATYKNEFADTTDLTLEVVEFNDRQIRSFLASWAKDMPPEKSIEHFMQTLYDRPRLLTLARNPLILTIFAYLYTDKTSFVLPHSRAAFYQESTKILLEQWDQYRQTPNNYQGRDKRLVLRHLALYAQNQASSQLQDPSSLHYLSVLHQVQQILPSLNLDPEQDARALLNEIVKRSGLLLAIDGSEKYQFAHLTLQEFFAAEALLEKENDLIECFKADSTTWRETVKLWCELAENSTTLIEEVNAKEPITAFECLADAQKVDPLLAEKIIDKFKIQLGKADNKEPVIRAFAAVAADTRPISRGEDVFKFLEDSLLRSGEPTRKTAAAQALSMTNLPKAAKLLAQCYAEKDELRPTLHEPLIRMGDLAVSAISYLVEAGSVELMDLLVAVETPSATRALVPWLWHTNQNLSCRAAWLLAHLLRHPKCEEVLKGYELKEEQKRVGERLDWIWKPFEESPNSTLTIIAGRVAYLISKTPVRGANRLLDPRLVIPICLFQIQEPKNLSEVVRALGSRKIQEPINLSEYLNEKLRAQSSFDHLGLGIFGFFDVDVDATLFMNKQGNVDVIKYYEWIKKQLGQFLDAECGFLFLLIEPSLQILLLRKLITEKVTKNQWLNSTKHLFPVEPGYYQMLGREDLWQARSWEPIAYGVSTLDSWINGVRFQLAQLKFYFSLKPEEAEKLLLLHKKQERELKQMFREEKEQLERRIQLALQQGEVTAKDAEELRKWHKKGWEYLLIYRQQEAALDKDAKLLQELDTLWAVYVALNMLPGLSP